MKITFRASFAGPTGVLNPSGWKIPKPDAQKFTEMRVEYDFREAE